MEEKKKFSMNEHVFKGNQKNIPNIARISAFALFRKIDYNFEKSYLIDLFTYYE